jgi:hypothetical protein
MLASRMLMTVNLFMVGAALLALWAACRFPDAGPRSLLPALALVVVAWIAFSLMTTVTKDVLGAIGPAGTLMLDVLPPLVFVFWAWACLVRALLAMIAPLRR